MTDRWTVWAGTTVAAVVLLVSGQRWWAVLAVAFGGFASSRLGGPRLDPVRDFDEEIRETVFVRAGGRCQWPGCGVLLHRYESVCPLGGCDDDFHCDHVQAHANGGRTVLANAQALCRRHNLEKSDH